MSPFLHLTRLDRLELLQEQGLTDERDSSAGGASHVRDGRMRWNMLDYVGYDWDMIGI